MKTRSTVWDKIDQSWPARAGNASRTFEAIKQEAWAFLHSLEIPVHFFSHYGLIVRDIDRAMATLNRFYPMARKDVTDCWVAAYKVRVARCMVADRELEFVAPSGPSFFNDFLNASGEGLHHLGFYTSDMQACLLKLRKCPETLLDAEPRQGSHGAILFLKPDMTAPVLIELCQKNQQGNKNAQ